MRLANQFEKFYTEHFGPPCSDLNCFAFNATYMFSSVSGHHRAATFQMTLKAVRQRAVEINQERNASEFCQWNYKVCSSNHSLACSVFISESSQLVWNLNRGEKERMTRYRYNVHYTNQKSSVELSWHPALVSSLQLMLLMKRKSRTKWQSHP